MSKIKAVLVTLMLGSSSAAMADSAVSFTAQANLAFGTRVSAPITRDHRTDQAYQMPGSRYTSWISLGSPLSLSAGVSTVRPSLTNITELRLQASSGMSYVRTVQIRFRDDSVQNINLNQWITSNDRMINVSLKANRYGVDSITVRGSAARNAKYQMFAQGTAVAEVPPPVYQPPVYQPPVYQPPIYQGLSIGSGMSFLGTDGRRFMSVGADKGTFRTLRLQGESGSTFVQMVKVSFTNGTEQFLGAVHQTLGRGQSIDIPLDGNGKNSILQVTVWTADSGMPITTATGTFNASLL